MELGRKRAEDRRNHLAGWCWNDTRDQTPCTSRNRHRRDISTSWPC